MGWRREKEHKSNVLEFTTTKDEAEYKDAPLTPPSHLIIDDVTEDTVTLSWGSSPGAEAYDIYINGAWKGGIWENSVTTATYGPLEAGETYTFKVGAQRSVNGALEASANSNAVTLKWGTGSTSRVTGSHGYTIYGFTGLGTGARSHKL